MFNFFARQGAAVRNEMNQSLGALLGIAQGLVCDGHLNDGEIRFLRDWLEKNDAIRYSWPGDVVHARVTAALADGVVTDPERAHLADTLMQLIGGRLDEIAEKTHATELELDHDAVVVFPQSAFCLTGDFVYAPRKMCEDAIVKRGGSVSGVNKKLNFLVVGGLGSKEWKHGSFGIKVEKTMLLRGQGLPVKVVHEDQWARAL